MTDPEFTRWMNRLRVAFPDVWEWLSGFDDCAETQACWRQTLRPFTLSECLMIIDNWITRERPVPKRYEFGQLAIIVANSIEFDRAKERAKEREFNGADRSRFSFTEKSREDVLRQRRGYQPSAYDGRTSLGQAIRRGQELVKKLKADEIDEADFRKLKQEIIDGV